MKLAGVVVLYNPEDDVKDNIKTYIEKVDKLYVVDNSINSNNIDKLPKSKKIKYINNGDNLGIATALNIACKSAIEEGFDYILTMDQDSKFHDDNLDKLIKFIKENKEINIGILTPYHVIKTNVPRPKEEIDFPLEVMTSGNILNLKAYQEVGGFKDWLFIDSVDIELCMNLRVHGYEIVRLNYSELDHNLGDSKIWDFKIKKIACSNHNYIRRYFITRNTLYVHKLYKKHFPEYCAFLKGGLKYQVRNILFFEKDKYRKIRNMYRGYKDFKRNVTGKYPYEN